MLKRLRFFPPCWLPLQKIFLDTIRLIAKRTDNLVDELWYYIKDGKLVQTALLLLAAQKHIRMGSSCGGNGNSKSDGFAVTINRIQNRIITLESEAGHNRKNDKGLGMEKRLTRTSLMLVRAVSRAGVVLDGYIQSYPEVPKCCLLQLLCIVCCDVLSDDFLYIKKHGLDIFPCA